MRSIEPIVGALGDEEQYTGLPLHYLFGAIPVGGNA
jgi:hypothetical protein